MDGVEVARRLSYDNVVLEFDAVNVVHTICNKQVGLAPIFLILDEVLCISREFNWFRCCHVKIVGNTAAHLVARWDTSVNSERICMNSFSQSLHTLVDLDISL